MKHASLLADLINLISLLKTGRATEQEHYNERDRRIGQALVHLKNRPVAQLRQWLGQVKITNWQRCGEQGSQLHQFACLLLLVAGAVAGWGVSRTLLYYDGSQPINIISVVALLVLLQIVLVAFWLLAALPSRIPLFSQLQSALRLLNPARLVQLLLRHLPSDLRDTVAPILNHDKFSTLQPLTHWLLMFWSQLFALSFNIAAVVTAIYLVSFSDLAFAWSTTLALSADTLHQIVTTLAWPWQNLFPEAIPSIELIELSRYYRLEEGVLGNGAQPSVAAHQLGEWWPFLITATLCYGLLPRLVTLTFSYLRYRHYLRLSLLHYPGAAELLARMNSPLVSSAATEPEVAFELDEDKPSPAPPRTGDTLRCSIIHWSNGNDTERLAALLNALSIKPLGSYAAGGAQSTAADLAALHAAKKERPQGVAIIVKSWEPPLLEFLDFLQSAREIYGPTLPLIILLLGEDGEAVQARDDEMWRITLRQQSDPKLHIERLS